MNENKLDHSGYSRIAELEGPEDSYVNSKYFQRAAVTLGKGINQIIKKVPPDYFPHESQIEHHVKFSEQLSNTIYWSLPNHPFGQFLIDKIEGDLVHGKYHNRRLEKIYKAGQAADKELRSNPYYLYFSLPGFAADRYHDVAEPVNGFKDGHTGVGALFALGVMLQSKDLADEAVKKSSDGRFAEFPHEDWIKMAWATAFMCLHHTRPEQMPETEDLLEHGLFDPNELLRSVEETAAEHKMTPEEYFPPYEIIRTTIQAIRDGKLEIPTFTPEEVEGLKRHTRFFAGADKLDSNYPPDLSAIRTFQTSADRPFFIRLEENVSPEEELEIRLGRCVNQVAPCDLDRLLYEISEKTRVHAFDDVSPVLHSWYAYALRKKGAFLDKAIPLLLENDGSGFLSAYDHLEEDMTRVILTKAEYDNVVFHVITAIGSKHPVSYITKLLSDKGFAADAYLSLLDHITEEREAVAKIIRKKILSLNQMDLAPQEKVRIIALLTLAQKQQDKELGSVPGPIKSEGFTPYDDGYYDIHLTKLSPKK